MLSNEQLSEIEGRVELVTKRLDNGLHIADSYIAIICNQDIPALLTHIRGLEKHIEDQDLIIFGWEDTKKMWEHRFEELETHCHGDPDNFCLICREKLSPALPNSLIKK